jgi:hypothetical protein
LGCDWYDGENCSVLPWPLFLPFRLKKLIPKAQLGAIDLGDAHLQLHLRQVPGSTTSELTTSFE